MQSGKKLYIAIFVVLMCLLVLWLSTSVGQSRRRYEVETQIYGVPEYRSDAARAIDAYERLMERHMDLTERRLLSVSADVKTATAKLDTIDATLTSLDTRIARIEKHLGIQPAPVVPTAADTNAPRVPAPSENAVPRPLPSP